MKRIYIYLFLLLFCVSCDDYIAYQKTYDIENNVLTGEKPLVFGFENEKDTFQLYDMHIEICYNMGLGLSQIPLLFSYVSPNGESFAIPLAIPVVDKNYKSIGAKQDDGSFILKETILSHNSMRTGKNTFAFAPATANDSLKGIQSVTFVIEKVN